MINYFQLYSLPESFHPDAVAVKNKFYELSRQYHPDRFARADDAAQAEALRMAALNNDAYKTFSNPDATMAYILKLHSLLEDEEKYSLPPAFLMEMMDLNEAISEYEMEPDNETMKTQAAKTLEDQLTTWNNEVAPLTKKFDEGDQSKELLLQVKDYYFRKKYLLRIKERIATFAAR